MDLIVYGSLMHPAEFSCLSPREAVPVWVQGFRRAFDQRPMWRGGGDPEHTVLAVRPDSTARFNGILLLQISAEHTPTLDYRERGYIRTAVPGEQLTPFEPEGSGLLRTETDIYELYVGRAENHSPQRSPLADYRTLCRRACEAWGEDFAHAFDRTTEV